MSNKWSRRPGNNTPRGGRPEEEPSPVDTEAPEHGDKVDSENGAAGAEAIDLGGAEDDAVAVLEAENAELKDQVLRALAELENLRRRTQKEKEDIGRFAVSNLARDMLDVADNLSRTLEAIPSESLTDDDQLSGLYQGIELIQRDLEQAFERHGITKILPLGEKFDHNLHQAMFEIENPDVEPGTVLQLMAPGYVLNGRLLRPAMVGVAKGGQKKPPAETAADGDAEAAAGGEPTDTTSDEGTVPPRH